MPHSLLIDNWTLQNAGEILCDGLNGDTTNELVFTKMGAGYGYEEVSADVVRFEALCQLLNNLVFADELYLDGQYSDTWARFEPVNKAHGAGILIKKPFKQLVNEWIPAREAMADRLCVNAPLLQSS